MKKRVTFNNHDQVHKQCKSYDQNRIQYHSIHSFPHIQCGKER